jgi:glycosyltransferase involved in cell wall biosynthesis
MRVIHLGIDTNKFYKKSDLGYIFDIQTKYSLPEKYILFVGNVKPHKNLTNLVLAFEILIREQNDIYLLIAGKKDGFITGDENLFRFINNNEILKSKIKFTGYIEENDLSYIYSLAQVFAFPSLYEGFGFPPLEAMASGCPVVASNAASIPEVCGNNVLYFNPLKPEEIYESLKIILVDELLRRSYIEKGLEHVKKFNWKKSGKEFVSVIESL